MEKNDDLKRKKSDFRSDLLLNMFYTNTDKTITSADKSVKHMVKMPMKGIYKFWLFWGVLLFLVAIFLIVVFAAFGHFILGH